MTTATASDLTVPLLGGRQHFLLRRLHSLTGILFGGYLIVHLVVNATLAEGNGIYDWQVWKIHTLPLLPLVEWTFIFGPMLFHMAYGVWITLTGQPNNGRYPFAKNWFYLLQRISAFYILGFMLFHVLSLKYGLFGKGLVFDSEHATQTVRQHLHASFPITWIVYPLGILASAFHTANGFWTAAVTWGLAVSAGAQRRWGWVCVGLFVILMVAGMTALVAGSGGSLIPTHTLEPMGAL